MKPARVSLILLAVQLGIVGAIAAKYAWQRATCPRVWTRSQMYDPELLMRGRYLSVRLTVDGCPSTLPSASAAQFPRTVTGVPASPNYSVAAPVPILFPARLTVQNNHLVALRIPDTQDQAAGQTVSAPPGSPCDRFNLNQPVDFYIPEHAGSPLPAGPGEELWVEVTVPPKGPPRPLQLALKRSDGSWQPLAYQ